MSFLRRLLGGNSAAAAAARWFDVPPSGSIDVAGVAHHKPAIATVLPPISGSTETRDIVAVLRRDPENAFDPNAVEVLIDSALVGYIPRTYAPAWSEFVGRMESEGLGVRVEGRAWVGDDAWFITLHVKTSADYRTKSEEAAYQQQRAVADAEAARRQEERDAARAERESAREAREAAVALAKQRRAAGVCATCGGPLDRGPRSAGRAAVRCADCRAKGVVEPKRVGSTREERARMRATLARPHPEVQTLVWRRSTDLAGWTVVDVDTTGLSPRYDRVVEIALLQCEPDGTVANTWTTLVDPERDMSAARFHGLSAADVRGAPTFRAVLPEVLARIAGTRLVAHNARFDLTFLRAEAGREGIEWDGAGAFCTMSVPYQLGLMQARRLEACCEELGIPAPKERSAAGKAGASAAILRHTLATGRPIDLFSVASLAPDWPHPTPPPSVRLRTDIPPPRVPTTLSYLADRVEAPTVSDLTDDAARSYLELLDRVLEDRRISDDEVIALAAVAEEWQIDTQSIRALHSTYLRGVWDLARADGVVTESEERDLVILTELLGVSVADADTAAAPPTLTPDDLQGKSVCFTGASVCTINGAFLERQDQEALAERAGLIVKSGVSSKLDILVVADPDSKSGKARTADVLGVRRITEPTFWRLLGVPID